MIKIEIKKDELEKFIDSLDKKLFKPSYTVKWKEVKNIKFEEFKKIFCNDKIDFSKDEENRKIYKLLYDKISSDKNSFYSEIRNFIIDKFTKKIKFCPYCWKNPLIYFDLDNNKKRMFQFDHFFPKNEYHKWIINFYNLIPSCNACNHLKSDDMPNWKIFHPYFWFINSVGQQRVLTLWEELSFTKNKRKLIYNSDHWKFFKLWNFFN